MTALDEHQMEVETLEGNGVVIQLDEATTYRNIDGEMTGACLQIGDRVVVDVTGPVEKFIATDVRSAPGSRTKPGSPHFSE